MIFDGLVQDCSNSTTNALELLQSCSEPSIYVYMFVYQGHSALLCCPFTIVWNLHKLLSYNYVDNWLNIPGDRRSSLTYYHNRHKVESFSAQ